MPWVCEKSNFLGLGTAADSWRVWLTSYRCACSWRNSHLHAAPHDFQGVDDCLRQHAGDGPVQQYLCSTNLMLLQTLQVSLVPQGMHSRATRWQPPLLQSRSTLWPPCSTNLSHGQDLDLQMTAGRWAGPDLGMQQRGMVTWVSLLSSPSTL